MKKKKEEFLKTSLIALIFGIIFLMVGEYLYGMPKWASFCMSAVIMMYAHIYVKIRE
jgi:hypothetical protein